jgi:uncharacterized protein YjbJ (UPF0337 family)
MEHMENATEQNAMNQDVFAGKWKQMRGTLKSWWGKLKEYTEGAGQTMKDTAQDLYQGAAKTYDDMKTKAQELGSAASEQAKNATAAVGEKMGSLASTIRQNVPQEGTVGSAATAVADNLEAAGSYLRDSNFEGMINDLTALIRRYPMQSLLVGLGIGYLWTRRSER